MTPVNVSAERPSRTNSLLLAQKQDLLRAKLNSFGRCFIAYSGGVDSGFLLWFAVHHSQTDATGVLADSESLKRSEKEGALSFATAHRLPLRILHTRELDNPDYQANPLNRCFYCKYTLFEEMERLAASEGVDALCYGENADDAAHDRPGRDAARQFAIQSPLHDCGLTKADIRALAAAAGLAVADKPAEPCLASRIQTGIPVTSERLAAVEAAEGFVASLGFEIVRVRHRGDHAVVQVAPSEVGKLLGTPTGEAICHHLLSLGFPRVELDPHGYIGPSLPTQ